MIVICGEAVFDMFPEPADDPTRLGFTATAAGSAFNVAVGCARQDAQIAFIGGVSTDMLGGKLVDILSAEGVGTNYLVRTDRPTRIVMVAVGKDGQPAYTFYGDETADQIVTPADMPDSLPGADILHIGSLPLVVEPVASAVSELLRRNTHLFISLDPNIRLTVEPDLALWRDRIDVCSKVADLVKVSEEDLSLLYPGQDPLSLAREWANGNPALVVLTRGRQTLVTFRGDDSLSVSPPSVKVADTVGAGDAFQASLLASLSRIAQPRQWLQTCALSELQDMLHRAAQASALTCMRVGAVMPTRSELDVALERARMSGTASAHKAVTGSAVRGG